MDLFCRWMLPVFFFLMFSCFGAEGMVLTSLLYQGTPHCTRTSSPLLTPSSTTCLHSVVSLGSPFPLPLPLLSIMPSRPLTLTNWRTDEEDGEDESGASRGGVHDNLYRVHMPSLYSCGSSYGSEASLPATAHTVSNAPVTEYMWVSTHR